MFTDYVHNPLYGHKFRIRCHFTVACWECCFNVYILYIDHQSKSATHLFTYLAPEHPSDFLQAAKEGAERQLLPFLLCGHQKGSGFRCQDYRSGGQVHNLSPLRTTPPPGRGQAAASAVRCKTKNQERERENQRQAGCAKNKKGVLKRKGQGQGVVGARARLIMHV